MSTPTLTPGTFLIFNNDSRRYMAADSSSASGGPVKTADAIDRSNPDNNRFVVSFYDQLRNIKNVATGLSLYAGADDSGNPVVIWTSENVYCWFADSSGPGIWDLNYGGTYCMDYKGASDHTIQMVPQQATQGARIQWILTAA